MTQELNALATNNTWILIPPPTNQRIIGCKWVYKVKHKPDGSIERYKARLVVKGYSQEAGIDYVETYSHVVRATTIRIILSLAVCSDWKIKKLDVSNAFLNGDLKETVYMHQP
jgi:Reverse transcriptase (RNA-dependent DNA polymerase)